jgi:hypothetical protein
VVGEVIHVDELMTRETFGLVVFVIHVLGQFGLQDEDTTQRAECEFFTCLVVVVNVLAHTCKTTIAINMIELTLGKNMFRHLDVCVFEVAPRHGAFSG